MLWSSFEHRLTADRAIGMVGDHFAGLLEASGISWAAITDPAARRGIVLQVLQQLPMLWIWDNVEPVTGFPAGTPSAWTDAEQDELTDLLRDLAQQTSCKVLLTSRRDEHGWLGHLPARVRLPAMPMRESLQLAAALAARHGKPIVGPDWRPLLRFAAGNPLTITVVTGQALRENLATREQFAAFVARLRAGEAPPESGQDVALGRTRSLAASLDYGFAQAFTDAERAQLAVLHLFRDTVDVDALRLMGDHDTCGDDAVPEHAGLDRDTGAALLDRAADIGLLSPLGGGYYAIHPALPWFFTALFTAAYGQPGNSAVRRAARAYAESIGGLGNYYHGRAESGYTTQVLGALRAEEGNLLHGCDLGQAEGLWDAMIGCLQGLRGLYGTTGRDGEWARLVSDAAIVVTDTATGEALPGREERWAIVTSYRVRLAKNARDWPTAASLQNSVLAWSREQAAAALSASAATLTPNQRNAIRNYGIDLAEYGDIPMAQDDPGCLAYYEEALALAQRIGDQPWEAQRAGGLGTAYLYVPGLRDLDQAERWFRHSLGLRPESDHLGRARNLSSLASVALDRFDAAREEHAPEAVLLKHLNDALRGYRESLDLTPSDDHASRGITENQIGIIYRRARDTGQALRHYQRAIQHDEARGNVYGAGTTRYNVALLLASGNRISDALHYARAALDNFRHVGPGAAEKAEKAEWLIAELGKLAP
jgi:tetratricopeptide (TPR) repeat protein